MRKPVRVAHVTTIDLTLEVLLIGQLRRLRDEGFEVTTISAPGRAVATLEAEGIRHLPWRSITRAWDPAADVRAFLELLRILRRERFDLVHAHNPKPGIMARIAARLVGVPCVVNTVHGLWVTPDTPAPKRLPVLALEWLAARCSDLELYQSEEDLVWARRIGLVDGAKSALLGNGTDLSAFTPSAVSDRRRAELRDELGIPEGALVVGAVGRIVAEKGYRELFEAASLVGERVPGSMFLIVGEPDPAKGDTLSEEELAAAPPNVVLAGWRRDIPDLLSLMDVFVLASWREGLPRSAIEAAAMGLPLVLTDIRGCREVARGGVEGLLVPPRSAMALADALRRLLLDPSLRARLGSAARSRAIERFDERRVEQILVDSYHRLANRKGLPQAAVAASS